MDHVAAHLSHAVIVSGFPDYKVCPCGYVISVKRKARILSSFPRDRYGHRAVNLCKNGRMKTASVSILVARALLDRADENQNCVLHKDDNPANNCLTNLEWGTNAENSKGMVERGRQSRGEGRPLSKLTAEAVTQIRELAGSVSQKELAARFGVSTSTLNSVVLRKTWRHIGYAD